MCPSWDDLQAGIVLHPQPVYTSVTMATLLAYNQVEQFCEQLDSGCCVNG